MNSTPHAINFYDFEGHPVLTVEPSGTVARAEARHIIVGTLEVVAAEASIPISKVEYGKVFNLPEPEEGTIYIVSSITAQACPEREDVFITDGSIRDAEGHIVGCTGVAHV